MRRRLRFLIFPVLILPGACFYKSDAALLVQPASGPGAFVINNARLFSGTPGDPAREGVKLLIRDGRVERISAQALTGQESIPTIDAEGMTVVPGLVDVHTHFTSPVAPPWLASVPTVERTLAAFLYAGVTTVLDQGSLRLEAAEYAAKERAGEILSPRIYHSGKPFAARDGHPAALIRLFIPWPLAGYLIKASYFQIDADNADRIKEFVAANKAAGAAYTKIYFDEIPLNVPLLELSSLRKVVAESRAAGLPVMVHVGREEHIRLALRAGARIFVHGPYRSSVSAATLRSMKAKKAIMAPTATVFDAVVKLPLGRWRPGSMDRAILDETEREAYADVPDDFKSNPEFKSWVAESARFIDVKFDNIRKYREAGLTVLAATDSPNLATVPGSAMHRELATFVEHGGFSASEALRAATYHPGRMVERIGGEKGLGRIAEGGPADLLLVRGKPDRNIQDLQNIDLIILKGRRLQRRTN